jgi:penicillin amidase
MRTPDLPALLSSSKLTCLVGLLLGCVGLTAEETAAENAFPDKTFNVSGLEQEAEIVVDHWGVPHIYAGTHYDAFFVQGFNAARDRLWQIDMWRRKGLGQLAEVLGADYVAADKASRLFLYRGDMYAEWLAYGSDAKRIAQSFTAGINAFVTLTRQQPELLPPEFNLLDYTPAYWDASDVVRIRSNGLWRNVRTEVRRAAIACQFDLETAGLWKVLEPQWQTRIPDGLDPCDIPDDVLDLYNLATGPITYPNATTDVAQAPDWLEDQRIRDSLGSNNWVVAPERTDTGRPILADDPHRGHAVPSLRYIAHLNAPGLDVIGAGEPALPGISIGHNGRIAFGLTIFPIDQEDLYVYDKHRGGYRYETGTEAIRTVTETIVVRDAADTEVTLNFTRHGPVIHETGKRLFALRAAWLEPGMAPYFGSIEYMRAQNWREFVAALNRWGAPSENQVYADTRGNIGYKPAGRFPKRNNFDGLMPVPGDGRYEWDGYFDMDVLPEEYNPARGFTGTANAMNLPANYPIADYKVGFEWSAPWRYRRLWEVLSDSEEHGLTDSYDLQRDYHSILAREVISRLPDTADQSSALAMLKNWNADLEIDSAAAALWAVWYYRYLGAALAAELAPGAQQLIEPLDGLTVLAALNEPVNLAVALKSLEDAWQQTRSLLGPNPESWRWGDLHQIEFVHPLQAQATGELADLMQYPSYPRGGSANTTNNTGFSAKDFRVGAGASFRMVLDVGRWDDAEMTNAPGQSGDPRSPFYRNLLQGWAEDSSFPMLYSREAVQANRAFTIKLLPVIPGQE